MPYAPYRMMFDRSGRLSRALERVGTAKPKEQTRGEFGDHANWLPFYVHDALEACERGNRFHAHSLLEEMGKLLFFAAARENAQIFGSKRAHRHLTDQERRAVELSYVAPERATVERLAEVYLSCLADLGERYGIAEETARLRRILGALG